MSAYKNFRDLPEDVLQHTLKVFRDCNYNQSEAARVLGIGRTTLQHRLYRAEQHNMQLPAKMELSQKDIVEVPEEEEKPIDLLRMRKILRTNKILLNDLATQLGAKPERVQEALHELRAQNFSVHQHGDMYWLSTSPVAATDRGLRHEYRSRPDGSFVFGFTSDNHLGSKYSRLDVLHKLYERFAEVGVDRVFNAGNWIDGEASFNKHDLVVHGMDAQCRYLANNWPKHEGIVTYAVTGDDHEGWYAQREGVDIGLYAERIFQDAGREDWVDLGYMEADIALIHAETGARNRLRVAHPGGGSAYATSYAPQKYIESLDGGDKPAVVLLGHWHKMELLNIRNVWSIQTGCTQDQTPFGRKKRLDFQVGGGICRIQMDPDTGAIFSCTVELIRFFNKAYYGTGRWSHHGDVTMPERAR